MRVVRVVPMLLVCRIKWPGSIHCPHFCVLELMTFMRVLRETPIYDAPGMIMGELRLEMYLMLVVLDASSGAPPPSRA